MGTASVKRKERQPLPDEKRIPLFGDSGGPLVSIVAHYEDGSSITFAHDHKAVRRITKKERKKVAAALEKSAKKQK